MGRGAADAAHLEEAADGRRSPAAGRSLARVSRRRVLPDRLKRVRHCCRSAARRRGAGEYVRRAREKTTFLPLSAARRRRRCAHARRPPARMTWTRHSDADADARAPSVLFELFSPRSPGGVARVRTGGHTGRCGSPRRQRGDAADRDNGGKVPRHVRAALANVVSPDLAVEPLSDVACVFLTGEFGGFRVLVVHATRRKSERGTLTASGDDATDILEIVPTFLGATRFVHDVSLGG